MPGPAGPLAVVDDVVRGSGHRGQGLGIAIAQTGEMVRSGARRSIVADKDGRLEGGPGRDRGLSGANLPGMAWVLDLDGVIWLGGEVIPGSPEAVAALREAGEEVVFATNNSSATIAEQEEKLSGMGIPADGAVVTSALAGARLLHPGERVLVVGGPGLREAVTAQGCRLVDTPECDAIISGLDRQLTYERLRLAGLAIRGGARWILTNSDPTFPTPHGLEPGAGSIGAAIATAGGRDPVIGGKPEGAMVDLLRERLGSDGTVVGDRLDTDGLFAAALGYRFGLVLSGVTTEDEVPADPAPWRTAPDLRTLVEEWRA